MSADGQEHSSADAGTGFFGVIAKAQSYSNIVYLLLGLPLGTLYFTLLVTGFSLGVSLIVIALLGIPILIGLWYVVRGVMVFERGLASTLLDIEIGPIPALPSVDGGLWTRFKAFMSDGPTCSVPDARRPDLVSWCVRVAARSFHREQSYPARLT